MTSDINEAKQGFVPAGNGGDEYPVLTNILSTAPDIVGSAENDDAWGELEERLAKQIQERVQERIGFILEEIIQQNLSATLQKMTGTLAQEINRDLQNTLGVVVTHAVSDELRRLKQKEYFSEVNRPKIEGDMAD